MGKGVHSAGWKEKMLEGIGNKQCKWTETTGKELYLPNDAPDFCLVILFSLL